MFQLARHAATINTNLRNDLPIYGSKILHKLSRKIPVRMPQYEFKELSYGSTFKRQVTKKN